jgi:hypothetical protein
MRRQPTDLEPQRRPVEWQGQPARACSNCQHWGPEKGRRDHHKECHNGISQRLEAHAKDSCNYGWYPDVVRFPIAKVYNP